MALRIVLMGTGGFALPTFRVLLESRHTTVGLFTQPDRTGRGHHHHLNPLKDLVAKREIPVFQPEKVNLPEPVGWLRSLAPEVCVVAAYGQILSAELIRVPRLGTVNVHASLLPKYRGAAPIQTAILNGDEETGVTIFQIEPKLDAGPLLAMERTPIGPKETAGEVEARLGVIGASTDSAGARSNRGWHGCSVVAGFVPGQPCAAAQKRERPYRLEQNTPTNRLPGSSPATLARGVHDVGDPDAGRDSAGIAVAADCAGSRPPADTPGRAPRTAGNDCLGRPEAARRPNGPGRDRDFASSPGRKTGHVGRGVPCRSSSDHRRAARFGPLSRRAQR